MNTALFRRHPRLWLAASFGALVFWWFPGQLSAVTRLLIAWNCGVLLFLGAIFRWMSTMTAQQIRCRYAEEDNSAPFILFFVTFAALLSVVAIVEPLATMRHAEGWRRIAHLVLAGLTLIDSWVLVPTLFTTHYTDMFYSVGETERPLSFPGTESPVFLDFAYFAFTIAAACQTSDVSTIGRPMRKVVIAHTIVSFFFNASILGFAINVSAGLIGGN